MQNGFPLGLFVVCRFCSFPHIPVHFCSFRLFPVVGKFAVIAHRNRLLSAIADYRSVSIGERIYANFRFSEQTYIKGSKHGGNALGCFGRGGLDGKIARSAIECCERGAQYVGGILTGKIRFYFLGSVGEDVKRRVRVGDVTGWFFWQNRD